MTKTRLTILSCLLWAAALWAQTPNFDYPCLIPQPEGYVVNGNDFAVPCVGDWDEDGDVDLFVGVMYDGYVIFYENAPTGRLPQFRSGVLLEADGEPISVSYA